MVTNLHGRRPGRGVRPWLLIPKVLFVSVYFGGMAATLAVWASATRWGEACTVADTMLLRHLFLYVVVPGLVGALLFGILLTLQHPGPLLRMRWLQVKLVWLVVGVPAAHLGMASMLMAIREISERDGVADASRFGIGLVVVLVGSVVPIVLGRHKPRLGQNPIVTHRPHGATA